MVLIVSSVLPILSCRIPHETHNQEPTKITLNQNDFGQFIFAAHLLGISLIFAGSYGVICSCGNIHHIVAVLKALSRLLMRSVLESE